MRIGADRSFGDELIDDVMAFIQHCQNMKSGENFYIGMWPAMLVEGSGRDCFDLWGRRADPGKDHPETDFALDLWSQQRGICIAQDVRWVGPQLQDLIPITPDVLSGVSGIDGRRYPVGEGSSGRVICNSEDDEAPSCKNAQFSILFAICPIWRNSLACQWVLNFKQAVAAIMSGSRMRHERPPPPARRSDPGRQIILTNNLGRARPVRGADLP